MRLFPCLAAVGLLASTALAQAAITRGAIPVVTLPRDDADLRRAAPAARATTNPVAPPVAPPPAVPPQGGGEGGASPVPEPSTLLLVGTGLVGLALTVRRRRRRA